MQQGTDRKHPVAEIARRCAELKSEHVLTFSLVCNPNPALIALVAQIERYVGLDR